MFRLLDNKRLFNVIHKHRFNHVLHILFRRQRVDSETRIVMYDRAKEWSSTMEKKVNGI
jgi:hypothetical protein